MDEQLDQREKLELAMLRAEHQKKFQMMINFIKEQVGEGVEYANSVARIVKSDSGAYYELLDLPEEFAGASGPGVELNFISEPDAIALLENSAHAMDRVAGTPTQQLQVFALYTRRGLVDRKNCYLVNHVQSNAGGPAHYALGSVQHGIMPQFFKIKVQTASESIAAQVGANHCILVCIVTPGDRYPLMRITLDSEHVTDLGAMARSRTIQ